MVILCGCRCQLERLVMLQFKGITLANTSSGSMLKHDSRQKDRDPFLFCRLYVIIWLISAILVYLIYFIWFGFPVIDVWNFLHKFHHLCFLTLLFGKILEGCHNNSNEINFSSMYSPPTPMQFPNPPASNIHNNPPTQSQSHHWHCTVQSLEASIYYRKAWKRILVGQEANLLYYFTNNTF